MARIPEAEVERLKKEISVQRLAEARGIKLHRHGADLLGLCPFHDDRNPSLVITPGKNLWHCLGACNAGGTVIDRVMRADGISFRHAVELLRADHLPMSAAPDLPQRGPVKTGTVRKLPPQTRRLLLMIDERVSAECDRQKMERSDYRFSRRDVREFTGWGDTQLKIHLHRLEEMEYLLIHRGGRGQSFVYELMFAVEGGSGRPMLGGLIDMDVLSKHNYDGKKSGLEAGKSGPNRPQVGGVSGAVKTAPTPVAMRLGDDADFDVEENTYTGRGQTATTS